MRCGHTGVEDASSRVDNVCLAVGHAISLHPQIPSVNVAAVHMEQRGDLAVHRLLKAKGGCGDHEEESP